MPTVIVPLSLSDASVAFLSPPLSPPEELRSPPSSVSPPQAAIKPIESSAPIAATPMRLRRVRELEANIRALRRVIRDGYGILRKLATVGSIVNNLHRIVTST